jgi:hypothetical protein
MTSHRLTITASYLSDSTELYVELHSDGRLNEADAKELAALFPKTYGLKAYKVSSIDGDFWAVGIRVNLHTNAATGERNEAAEGRLTKIAAKAKTLGVTIVDEHRNWRFPVPMSVLAERFGFEVTA